MLFKQEPSWELLWPALATASGNHTRCLRMCSPHSDKRVGQPCVTCELDNFGITMEGVSVSRILSSPSQRPQLVWMAMIWLTYRNAALWPYPSCNADEWWSYSISVCTQYVCLHRLCPRLCLPPSFCIFFPSSQFLKVAPIPFGNAGIVWPTAVT